MPETIKFEVLACIFLKSLCETRCQKHGTTSYARTQLGVHDIVRGQTALFSLYFYIFLTNGTLVPQRPE